MCAHVNADIFRGYAVCRSVWKMKGGAIDLTWPADADTLLDAPITRKRFDEDEYMPYWAQPWPAAVMLVEAILGSEPGRNRTAVEIGCGVGLVSVAAAMKGWVVTASDYDDDALAFAKLNAERNGVQLAGCRRIDYRQPLDQPAYDCILGADMTYEKRACEPLARWIASALKDQGFALVSDPNRSVSDPFVNYAQGCGLIVETESVQSLMPDGKLSSGRIWRLTHK